MYQEKQYFRQTWLILLFLGLNGLLLYGVVQQVILGIPFGNNPAPDAVLVLVWLFILGLSALFLNMSLQTQIDKVGIWFRFFPLMGKPRQIKWAEVASLQIRACRPLREFGGWGLRYGAKGLRAYTTSGRHGLEIHTKDGRKVFLGTQKPEQMRAYLKEAGKDYLLELVE